MEHVIVKKQPLMELKSMPAIRSENVNIANNDNTSSSCALVPNTLVGLRLPATFNGTAVTFLAGTDARAAATFSQLYVGGAALSVTVAAGKQIALNPSDFAGVIAVKLVSNANESGAREIALVFRECE